MRPVAVAVVVVVSVGPEQWLVVGAELFGPIKSILRVHFMDDSYLSHHRLPHHHFGRCSVSSHPHHWVHRGHRRESSHLLQQSCWLLGGHGVGTISGG